MNSSLVSLTKCVHKIKVTILRDFEAFVDAPDAETAIEILCEASLPEMLAPTHSQIAAKEVRTGVVPETGEFYVYRDEFENLQILQLGSQEDTSDE